MKNYEYKVEIASYKRAEDVMNEYGANGWRVIKTKFDQFFPGKCFIVFERETLE